MAATTNRYETTFIIKGSLQDAEIDQIIAKAEDFITKNGGEIVEMERWGRRKLAYDIERETQGYYTSAHFTAPGSVIARLERTFQLDESVIRWLTLVMPEKAVKGRAGMKQRNIDMAVKREEYAARMAAEAAAAQ
jgi:small subunit ribosomal protein S6